MHDFTVYFDFNKATLSTEAHTVIQQAAASAKQAPMTHVTVTGHTDTAGSADTIGVSPNAAPTRCARLAEGLPANEIVAKGVGKSELAVPTADGVKEPRNRRAVITEGGPGA